MKTPIHTRMQRLSHLTAGPPLRAELSQSGGGCGEQSCCSTGDGWEDLHWSVSPPLVVGARGHPWTTAVSAIY
jgi:hypothetical protein